MHIGAMQFSLYLPETFSLKEKRGIVKSAVERARKRFNASIAQVEDLDDMRIGTIGVVVVSNDPHHAEEMLRSILEFFERDVLDAELREADHEVFIW
jgi:uncharacterized protein YlxP (DUF503 family)